MSLFVQEKTALDAEGWTQEARCCWEGLRESSRAADRLGVSFAPWVRLCLPQWASVMDTHPLGTYSEYSH